MFWKGSISNMGKLEMHAISLLEISASQYTTRDGRDIIIVDLRAIEYKDVDWTGLAQMHVYWQPFVNKLKKCGIS
jgi:hypothetical protein